MTTAVAIMNHDNSFPMMNARTNGDNRIIEQTHAVKIRNRECQPTMSMSDDDDDCSNASNNINKNDDDNSIIDSDDIEYVYNKLTEDEIELAARMSYAYQTMSNPTDELRRNHCNELIVKYISSKSKSKIDDSLNKLKATLQFRQEMMLHDIDTITTTRQEELHSFMQDKKAYVQGYDKDGRATLLFIPRYVTDLNKPVQHKLGLIWNIEKAIACTKSNDQTINVVVDFNGFSMYYHSPSFSLGKDIMTTLRNHYVGQIHKIFLLNVPSAFTMLWSIFKSFAGTKTRNKIIFVDASNNTSPPATPTKKKNKKSPSSSPSSSPKSRTSKSSKATMDATTTTTTPLQSSSSSLSSLSEYYTADQSTTWMLPHGTKTRSLDVDEYINRIPFNQAFDE